MLRFASSIFSRRPQPKAPSKTAAVASPSTEVQVHTAQFFAGYVVDDGSPVIEDSEPLILEVKRVARRYNQRTGYYADEEDADVVKKPKDNTLDAKYAFSIVRKFHDPQPPETSIYFRPQQLLAWLPRFKAYLESCETHLKEASSGVKDTQQTVKHLQFFVHLLEDEHKSTLVGIDALLSEGKITFDLLWAIFLPGDVVISHCEVTGEPIATRLVSATSVAATPHFPRYYQLQCEFVDFNGGVPTITGIQHIIRDFEGPRVVSDLKVFPMEPFLPQDARAELRDTLIKRGKRCTELSTAWCHKRYSGIAYKPRDEGAIGINSRIVLDRTLYDQYELQTRRGRHTLDGQRISAQKFRLNKNEERRTQPTDDELMLMPAVLYGFSLGDRRWLRFNIEHVEDIVWNPVAFDYLDIPQEQKNIVRTLTESHARNAGAFDDFIEGKGVGLVFNLHGPPGVGKTLTAEATSEIARSPLYVVSAGDLGITATELDASLTIIFALAKAWKAVVLIDEADVFLEQRDLHDLARNAMVAVFLRQLEYFPGILMLTTNRVNIIDHAIKSRIHVSLLYDELDGASRKRLWRFFLAKAGLQLDDASDMVLGELAQLEFNGREIKNIIKVAVTFAAHHNRTIAVSDITQVIESNRQRKRGQVAGFDVDDSCAT